MRIDDVHDLTLPAQLVANAGFPYDAELAAARRFLAQRGITGVRPIYGPAAAKPAEPVPVPSAEERALARWFDVRCA
jgi:hypothetical protein